MFVAYTGYGRIATLGEEIRNPRRNIPRAIGATLVVSMLLYAAVGIVVVMALGKGIDELGDAQQAAPLEVAARRFALPAIAPIVAVGAMTAMLGVLLNLILGLSRVALAMGRRGDLPPAFARIGASGDAPYVAVIGVGAVIAGLAAIGNVKSTWSFSAFTVLIYYAITNLAAIRLSDSERLFPKFVPWIGLTSCLFLAFWIEPRIWAVGIGLIAAGLVLRPIVQRLSTPKARRFD
jgi:APA family basic amino acid/polyamine antiporter